MYASIKKRDRTHGWVLFLVEVIHWDEACIVGARRTVGRMPVGDAVVELIATQEIIELAVVADKPPRQKP